MRYYTWVHVLHATLFCVILTPQDIPRNLNVRSPSSICCVVYLIFGDHIALPDLHFKCGLLWAHTPIHWHEIVVTETITHQGTLRVCHCCISPVMHKSLKLPELHQDGFIVSGDNCE